MPLPESAAPASVPTGARRMVRTFVALLSGEVLTRSTMLVAALIAVRVLAPSAFGAYAYAVALASIVNFVVDLGISSLVTRDVAGAAQRASSLLGAFLKAQALLATLTFGLAGAFAASGFLGGPASTSALLLAIGAVTVSSMSRPWEATLTGLGRAGLLTVSRAVRGTVLVGATAVAATLSSTPEALLGAMVLAELAGALTVAFVCSALVVRPALRAPARDLTRLLRAAIPFALLVGFNVLYLRLDTLMLGWLDSDAAVGNYGVASRIMETALVLPAFFGSAFLATVGHTGARTARARIQTAGAMRNVMLLSLPFAIGLAYAASPLVRLLAGADYDSAGRVLALLSPMIVWVASYGVLANLQVALDHVSLLVRINVVGVVAKIALNLVAIPAYGVEGAAVVAVAVEAVVVVLQWWISRAYFEARALLGFLGRMLVAGALMGAAAVSLGTLVPWFVALPASTVVFGVAAVGLGCVDREEMRLVRAALRGAP